MYKALLENEGSYPDVNSWYDEFNVDQSTFERLYSKFSKRTSVVLKRNVNDVWINAYNETLLKCWDANIDMQYILDPYSCIVYILSYISKSEKELSLVLESLKNDTDLVEKDSKEILHKLGSFYLQNREISAQEATYRVCNLRLKECSRKVEFVPSGPKQIRLSLPIANLKRMCQREQEVDSGAIWAPSKLDRYKSRPNTDVFESMSFADFVSQYRTLSTTEVKTAKLSVELKNELGWVQKRTRTEEAIIRYPRFSSEEEPELYYKNILRLFLPHYYDEQLLPNGFSTHEEFYCNGHVRLVGKLHSVRKIVNVGLSKYEKNTEADSVNIVEILNNNQLEDAWAMLAPETDIVEEDCREDLEKVEFEKGELEIPDLNKNSGSFSVETIPNRLGDIEGRKILQSLNTNQKLTFNKIREWCINSLNTPKTEPFYVFITGGGGSGKSHLCHALYFECDKIFRQYLNKPESDPIAQTASTGIAAFNIGGTTLHSAFKLFFRGNESDKDLIYIPLKQDTLNTLRAKYIHLKILIIDEISMVSEKMLFNVSSRLQQIKQNNSLPFGGVSVIAIGDFFQLPPVKGRSVYSKLHVTNIWSLFTIVELTEVMRQKNDQQFIEILNFIRTKSKSEQLPESYKKILQSRCGLDCSEETIRIVGTNKEVSEHNDNMVAKCCDRVIEIKAIYLTSKSKMTKKSSKSSVSSLPLIINVGIGAKIMLIKNLNLSDGLINGALGVIKSFSFDDNNHVEVIWIKFNKNNIGLNTRKNFYHKNNPGSDFTPISRCEEGVGCCVLAQFPIKLAWACTVHKTQGLTLDEAVVSMKHIFSAGQAYVGLSRVKSLEGLFIDNFTPDVLYCNDFVKRALETMPRFLPLPNEYPGSINILYLNVQGLNTNINDVIADMKLHRCDIMTMCETKLNNSQLSNVSVANYCLTNRDRKSSYNKAHDMCSKPSGGGVGIYTLQSIDTIIFRPKQCDIEYLRCYCVSFDLYITVIYRPPDYKNHLFVKNLEKLLKYIFPDNSHSIITGDFNENLTDGSTYTILNCFSKFGYTQLVNTPTTDRGTLIDHVYVKNIQLDQIDISIQQSYYSYHQALLLTLKK